MYNYLFGYITENLKKRIFRFILKRTFDRFVKPFDLSQVDIAILSGEVNLNNLQLNTEVRLYFVVNQISNCN